MKSIFTMILAMTALVISANAQKARFGIQAGMSLASVHNEGYGETVNLKLKPGFTAGMMMDMKLGKNLVLQPELNWVQKGGNQTVEIPNDTRITAHFTLNYLELPVKLLYRAQGDHGFFIGGGPAIAYGLYGKIKVGDVSENVHFGNPKPDSGFTDQTVIGKPFDVSAQATAGYLSQRGFQVSVTYAHGLTNYSNEPDYISRNNHYALRLGYLIHYGKH